MYDILELSDLRGLAIGFYQEVWASLDHAQKILYRGVMMGSCGNLASVGKVSFISPFVDFLLQTFLSTCYILGLGRRVVKKEMWPTEG